ncbi:MAG: glycosyltransferase family 4 protein [Symploca sp. SIO1C4]|uniref:Glycosyltransferase family 4 protein n=1 Tax=Symploca sp. SIO1C4 TaxID=2607765 RepID=A0A6B3NI19_9CYAN|nr:glycosyltransferase family 4 protein [Symploca sp. SIO1C4]
MKIAFVAQPFDVLLPIPKNSISIWADEISTNIAQKHEVLVYSSKRDAHQHTAEKKQVKHIGIDTDWDNKLLNILNKIQVRIQTILSNYFKIKTNFYSPKAHFFRWYYYWFYITAISLALKGEKVEAVIVPNFSQFLPIIRYFNKDVKIILVMQCDWLIEIDSVRINSWIKSADLILGCSNHITQGIRDKLPQFKTRCKTLYNGTNITKFNSSQISQKRIKEIRNQFNLKNEQVILSAGRITPEKGLHVLIEAMKLVVAIQPESILLVAGPFATNAPSPIASQERDSQLHKIEKLKNNYKGYLKSISYGIEEKVKFLGSLPHAQLAAYYSLCDIFVHPSVWNEPFGMILTEAMSCQRPVISTYRGGIPEIVVHNQTGLLVQPNDPQALAEAILQLLKSEVRRQEMGRAGKIRVEQEFSWEKSSRILLGFLDEMQ